MNSPTPHARRDDPRSTERLDHGVWASVALHLVLGVLLVTSPALFPAFGDIPWGSEAGGGGAMSITLVDSSGIPLPAPDMTRPDAVGNESAGLFTPIEAPETTPETDATADAELIPETFTEDAETEGPPAESESTAAETDATPAPPTPAASAPPENPTPAPDNAVPFGQGGQPDLGTSISSGQGVGGLDVGDGSFGQQYGRYVNAMRRRVSDNWYQSMLDANVRSGLRVTLEFEILRSGEIRNVRVVESSGVRSLDDSAERAIYRVRQLEPLPATYRGASIDVQFWFEFTR